MGNKKSYTADTPHEIERKYLIKRPSDMLLGTLPSAEATEITQTYLFIKEDGVRRRVRKRGSDESGFKYYYTEKSDVAFGERIERECEISSEEYSALLTEADPSRTAIEKRRICFTYDGQFFELDIYPFGEELATLEIELDDINTPVRIPECLTVVCDVTGDKRYNNSTLAATRKLVLFDDLDDLHN
jgi:CYTH domain-containing protein